MVYGNFNGPRPYKEHVKRLLIASLLRVRIMAPLPARTVGGLYLLLPVALSRSLVRSVSFHVAEEA